MSEPIAKHQIFEYDGKNPFHIYNLRGELDVNMEELLNHWHTELELAFITRGKSIHYVDGNRIEAGPGNLVVVNSESVHNIIPDTSVYDGSNRELAVIIIISFEYVKSLIGDAEALYFLQPQGTVSDELREILMKISEYANWKEREPYDELYIKGLISMLIFQLCKNGVEKREHALPVNFQRNVERLRGVISYIEQHYKEPMCQAEVAAKFYFSREYFSRFFKKSTGYTFVEYVTMYRVNKARLELLDTSKNILDVALENGFSDSRRFINAFRKQYGTTPLQYRKQAKHAAKNKQ